MGLFRGVLLGTGAALVSVAAAQAADLPSRKAAPVEYVRVCDAYGAGFFFIPGTQTCLRIGGRVRADYAFVPAKTYNTAMSFAGVPTDAATTAAPDTDGQHTVGWEARGRINVDARTQTAYGTVQAAFQLRMARGTGVIAAVGSDSRSSTSSTLESAFIRFAGFTFGASRDNFAFMPSLTYGAGHWASFGNGANQLAYTHSFGGGFSATVALQDYRDTGGSAWSQDGASGSAATAYYVHNSLPQVNARLDWQQGWGELSVMGAVTDVSAANAAGVADASKTVYALGAGLKLNLPMLANGSAIWFTGAYANGMTEYTTNYGSFKSSSFARDVGGFVINHPSVVFEGAGTSGDPFRIETVKSWNLAALLQHFWAPQWRSVAWASYGQIDAPTTAAARSWNGTTGFGDATVWNVGKQIAWLPTRDFEIGVEVIYSRLSQDVRSAVSGTTNVYSVSDGNWTGRLRVERNF